MALPSYLANIKSSGMYRFVWDKSEIPNIEPNVPLRLVVGYSEKGPFNTPVYVRTQTEFRKIYGGISKKLERYGCFFHRLALQALRRAPILCLNLKNFNTETLEAVSFNMRDFLNTELTDSEDVKVCKGSTEVPNIFNTAKFWTLEPEILEDPIELEYKTTIDDEEVTKTFKTSENYITITATDSKESSNTIFIRGYEPAGYNVTFKEWYSSVLNGAEVPSYVEGFENNKLNRYWAEVYVFKGQFTPEIATSNVLAKYFDVTDGKVMLKPYITNAFGEKKDALDMLAANEASNFIRKYQGILLPEFVGANGSPLSLDILFNSDNDLHKMMMHLNQTLLYDGVQTLDDIDTTGWAELMEGANEPTADDQPLIVFSKEQSLSVDGITPIVYGFNWVAEDGENPKDGSWDSYIATAKTEGEGESATTTPCVEYDGMAADFYMYNLPDGVTMTASEYVATLSGGDEIKAHALAKMGISTGDAWVVSTGETGTDTPTQKVANITKVKAVQPIYRYVSKDHNDHSSIWGEGIATVAADADQDKLNDGYTKVTATPDSGDSGTFYIKSKAVADGNSYNMLYTPNESTGAMEAIGIDVQITLVGPSSIEVTFDTEVSGLNSKTYFIKGVGSVMATSINLVPTYIQGYEYGNKKPASSTQDAKAAWVDYQLSILDSKGLRSALTNRKAIAYRYIVDTFESFAVAGECKAKLALLCKLRESAVGLLNFPAMKSFAKSSIMFKGEDGNLDTAYIAQGCNPMYSNGAEFKLASQDNGASYVSYNTALVIEDPETGVRATIPSAALVSNDFIDKYEKFLPYSIVAGPKRGSITDPDLIGPDFNFGRDDLDNLEPMGVNCMVYVPGKGTYINSNQTAKQNPVTALSKLHIRELCIFLQDEIENMMEYYHWDFNTPNLRQTLKDRADVICETCKNNDGCYVYYNQCDSQNNTPEIIDNEMIILSTSIEPSRGAGKMIHELTLYRTGGLSIAIKDA